jgi:ABC-type polysaccharide/polyol phosphate export systems, permease component
MSTRFGSKPGGYIWALLDPAAHIAFLSLIFIAISRSPALGTSYPLFFATGYICYQFYHAMAGYLNSAVSSNRALLNYPNVAPIDTIFARYILQFGTTCVVGFVVLAAIIVTLRTPPTIQWQFVVEAAFAASLLAFGSALANNVLFQKYPLYEKVYGIVTRPLFLVSGILYIPDHFPQPVREILLANPVAHVIILFRKGFYLEYRGTGLDMGYFYSITLAVLFCGLALFTFSRGVLRGR